MLLPILDTLKQILLRNYMLSQLGGFLFFFFPFCCCLFSGFPSERAKQDCLLGLKPLLGRKLGLNKEIVGTL